MATQIKLSKLIHINFTETLNGSKVSFNGSGVSGTYIHDTQGNQLRGSGGGVLACLTNVILINITGNVSYQPSATLFFTALLSINISGNSVTLNIINSFVKDSNNNNYTITVTDNCSNAVLANNTRYLNIGSFTLNIK